MYVVLHLISLLFLFLLRSTTDSSEVGKLHNQHSKDDIFAFNPTKIKNNRKGTRNRDIIVV